MNFSVVIPLYNKAAFVRDAVGSVLAQSLKPAEIIVVDDGSKDGGAELLDDLPIRVVRQANQGPGAARNHGVSLAKSEWVAFLDADDLWLPNHLETLADIIAAVPEAGLISTSWSEARAVTDHGPPNPYAADFYGETIVAPIVCASTAAARADVLRADRFILETPSEDSELWTRIALSHPVGRSPKVTAFYRRGTGGLMDSFKQIPFEPGKEPEMQTLDTAIAEPRYAKKREVLRAYKQHLLNQRVTQALYAADRKTAKVFMKLGGGSPYGKLAILPNPLIWLAVLTWECAKRTRLRK